MRSLLALMLVIGLGAAIAAQPASKTTWDGVYSAAQSTRGEAAYTKTCSGCHGPDLMGADTAPSLTGPEFNASWNDQSVDDLAERIRTTMPADAPGSLSRTDVADVISFILSKDGFPPGSAELPATSPDLKAIKILAKKP